MKMKKFNVFLVFSFLFSTALHAQPITSEQTNFIKRQYNSFIDDVKLIRKCYLKKTPACSDNERAEAKKAAVRVTVKGLAAVVGAILGTAAVGYGTFYGARKYKREKIAQATIQDEVKKEQAKVDKLIKEYNIPTKKDILLAFAEVKAKKIFGDYKKDYEKAKKTAKNLLNKLIDENDIETPSVYQAIYELIIETEPKSNDQILNMFGTYFGWWQ